jgi:DNA-binding FadR family transcriptional regulator
VLSKQHKFWESPLKTTSAHDESISSPGTLADRVTSVLQQKIRSGEFAVDTCLPSEAALTQRFNVSRTVVREAVSRLKAEGLVATHQGKGTVVVGAGPSAHFKIDVDVDGAVQAVLRVMELRSGLEAEAAALAAERRTAGQNAAIQRALEAIDEAVSAGRDGVDEDVAFHNAIANATGNPLYLSLLGFLRQFLREAVTLGRMSEPGFGEIKGRLRDEHRAVAEAIGRGDPEGARNAARTHIANVAARIRGADVSFWSGSGGEAALRLAKSEEQMLKQVP